MIRPDIFINDIDRLIFDAFKKQLPPKLSVIYEGYGPKGFFTVVRQGFFFHEIAHIISDDDTSVRPYFRWYVNRRTEQLIRKIIDDSKAYLATHPVKPQTAP